MIAYLKQKIPLAFLLKHKKTLKSLGGFFKTY